VFVSSPSVTEEILQHLDDNCSTLLMSIFFPPSAEVSCDQILWISYNSRRFSGLLGREFAAARAVTKSDKGRKCDYLTPPIIIALSLITACRHQGAIALSSRKTSLQYVALLGSLILNGHIFSTDLCRIEHDAVPLSSENASFLSPILSDLLADTYSSSYRTMRHLEGGEGISLHESMCMK
jgi:hypothetical protein